VRFKLSPVSKLREASIIRIQAPGRFRKESFENYLEAVFCTRDAVVMAEGRTECDQEVVKLTHHFVATASDAFRTSWVDWRAIPLSGMGVNCKFKVQAHCSRFRHRRLIS
jgi:hypothetical protein